MKRFNSFKKVTKALNTLLPTKTPTITLNHIYGTSPSNTLVKYPGPSLVLTLPPHVDDNPGADNPNPICPRCTKSLATLELTARTAIEFTKYAQDPQQGLEQAIVNAKGEDCQGMVVEARFVPLLNVSAGTAATGNGSFVVLGEEAFWDAARRAVGAWGVNLAVIVRSKGAVARKPLPLPKDHAGLHHPASKFIEHLVPGE